MNSEKKAFSDENPFKRLNPNDVPAVMWEKVHGVEMIAIENQTDIKWLKKEYAVQMVFSIATFLTLLGLIHTILTG